MGGMTGASPVTAILTSCLCVASYASPRIVVTGLAPVMPI